MSSMLEQAIVDAAALRQAALKNAEQSVIDKYAPEIKAAVENLLESVERSYTNGDVVRYEGRFARVMTESDSGKIGISFIGEDKTQLVLESDLEMTTEEQMLQEQDAMAAGSIAGSAPASTPIEAPFAAADVSPNRPVEMDLVFDFDESDFLIDLDELKQDAAQESADEQETIGTDELVSDLGLAGEEEAPPEEGPEDTLGAELALQEIMDILNEIEDEEEILEEELIVDTSEVKHGWTTTDSKSREYDRDLELARMESTKFKEENEELMKKLEELSENVEKISIENKQLRSTVNKFNSKLNETLLSNAKLLYSNRILSDASLNERQKTKIVEAIAQSKTPDEARSLCETLKTTVGSTKKDGPKSLSESVQRKSNLSSILPRRRQENSQPEDNFSTRMRTLAGIK
jgi:hypothetical protein